MTRFSSVRAISGDRMYLATIECDECSGSYPTSTNVVVGDPQPRSVVGGALSLLSVVVMLSPIGGLLWRRGGAS